MSMPAHQSGEDAQEQIANAGRIPKRALEGASVALFIIAIITATARTAIRLKQQRRLYVDDVFLFIAVIFLVASMGLLWHQLDEMYTAEALVTNSASFVALTGNWIDQLFWFLKISDAFLVLSWTSVLAVKFSFLFFFRNLIDRVRGMKTYWWIVMAITLAVWAFGCGAVFAPCPYFDLRSLSCSQGPQYGIAVAYSAAIIALDIVTDILILVIPIYLISKIQIKLRQKLALGGSLCLSIIIIIISITCIAGIRAPTTSDAIDVTWELFWQASEACVAVTMVSLIAFRSLFIAHTSRHQRSPPQHSPASPQKGYWERRRLRRKERVHDSDETAISTQDPESGGAAMPHAPAPAASRFRLPGFRALPEIPSARLSGLNTRFGPGRRALRSDDNIMRSRASSHDEAEKGPDRGSTDRRTLEPSDNQVSSANQTPRRAVDRLRQGTALSATTTLREGSFLAEVPGSPACDLRQASLLERPESGLNLPIQVPFDKHSRS